MPRRPSVMRLVRCRVRVRVRVRVMVMVRVRVRVRVRVKRRFNRNVIERFGVWVRVGDWGSD